jgi:2-keto-4-pentenoate hydratase/2-oxohepta-3-ene-1,7-dioic acid hydratase in catechol pathway
MKIICIGRNYADHAKELGNALPTEPLFFCKPDSAILPKGNPFFIPEWSKDIHYEIEILFKINRLGKYIQKEHALKYVSEIGIGIDFTARDIQEELKKKGLPWEKAKGFDGSAVIAEKWIPIENIDLNHLNFGLKKNGEWVQQGHTKDMIFNIESLIEHVSQFMTLKIGDIIFSGTPHGVGPVQSGDVLEGFIGDTLFFELKIK